MLFYILRVLSKFHLIFISLKEQSDSYRYLVLSLRPHVSSLLGELFVITIESLQNKSISSNSRFNASAEAIVVMFQMGAELLWIVECPERRYLRQYIYPRYCGREVRFFLVVISCRF